MNDVKIDSSGSPVKTSRSSPKLQTSPLLNSQLECIKRDSERELLKSRKKDIFHRTGTELSKRVIGSVGKNKITIAIRSKSLATITNSQKECLSGKTGKSAAAEEDPQSGVISSLEPEKELQPDVTNVFNQQEEKFDCKQSSSLSNSPDKTSCSSDDSTRSKMKDSAKSSPTKRISHSKSRGRKNSLKITPKSVKRQMSPVFRKQKMRKSSSKVICVEDKRQIAALVREIEAEKHSTPQSRNGSHFKGRDDTGIHVKESKTSPWERYSISNLPESSQSSVSNVDENSYRAQSPSSYQDEETSQTSLNELSKERTRISMYGSLCSPELMSSCSSMFSSTSSDETVSSYAKGGSGDKSWPFNIFPSYSASTHPPPHSLQSPYSPDNWDKLGSPSISTPKTFQEKRYQCLQPLHDPPRPNFHGFQLIGDSMLLRFSQQILGEAPIIAESLRFLGYCVSGQRIGELLKRLRSGFYHIGKKVVLMIGTNDLLKQTGVEQMCSELHCIVKHLREVSEQVVILTLPPVPRLENSTKHWRCLDEFNAFIKKLSITDCGVKVSDLFPMYVCSEEEAEERENTIQYDSNSLFCYGCFTCVDNSNDFSCRESEDIEETIDTFYSHTSDRANPFISISDVSPLFMDRRIPKCRMDCFEVFFADSTRKDMIHLNNKGLQIVNEYLRKYLP